MVARRGRLSGLPPVLSGLERRRHRRPRRDRARVSTTSTWLGVDALWLSPIYPSPLADFGYDVTDHTAVDPVFGTLEDFDRLLAAAHDRGLRVLLDLVASHTSIEHPWFREHPEWYVWAEGEHPPNNWIAAFGGPSWTRLPGTDRWYLHSFYPEQPDLDWRNPEVRAAMGDVVRFWVDRGVDGFRVDAADRLLKDPELRDEPPATAPFGLPLPPEVAEWDYMHSGNAPDMALALAAIREAAGDALLVGEVYLPSDRLGPYLEHFDLAFAFELLHAPPRAEPPRRGDRLRGRTRACRLDALQPRLPQAGDPLGARARGTRPPCSCSPCPAPRSSTRGTSSAWPTARARTHRWTGTAATGHATRSPGRPAGRGFSEGRAVAAGGRRHEPRRATRGARARPSSSTAS